MNPLDRRTRAGKLYAAARDEYEKEADRALGLMRGFAVMLAMSAGWRTEREKKEAKAKLPFTPQEFYEMVKERCPEVACVPVSKNWFGHLGRQLQAVGSLRRGDMELFCEWVEAGGLPGWTNGVTDFGTVCRKFPSWMAMARSWGESIERSNAEIEEAFK